MLGIKLGPPEEQTVLFQMLAHLSSPSDTLLASYVSEFQCVHVERESKLIWSLRKARHYGTTLPL